MDRMEATSLRFAAAARALTHAARRLGLVAPDFRTPPRRPGSARTLRRGAGAALVSVLLQERPWVAVLADMVDGIVAVNELAGSDADAARDGLWGALEAAGALAPEAAVSLGPRLRAVRSNGGAAA
jgi:hypothetical protein